MQSVFFGKYIADSAKECQQEAIQDYPEIPSLRKAGANPTRVGTSIDRVKVEHPYYIWDWHFPSRGYVP
jgi:hypothetical protein